MTPAVLGAACGPLHRTPAMASVFRRASGASQSAWVTRAASASEAAWVRSALVASILGGYP